ncbi:GtrA family protein [Bacillus sp. JJ1122]|uniref:GtrA family protein n=1 Tax=Bacillus sp. JJ1122 TaxID=3122951 RepID=UPI002FFDF569
MSHLTLKLGSCLKITNKLVNRLMRSLKINPTFLKFLLVGVLNTFIGLGIMFCLKNGLQWPYWIATFTGNTAGAVVSFFLNRVFTFNSKVRIKEGALKFTAVILICYLLSFSVSKFLSSLIDGRQELLSTDNLAIIFGAGIYTITNYFGQKIVVFQK